MCRGREADKRTRHGPRQAHHPHRRRCHKGSRTAGETAPPDSLPERKEHTLMPRSVNPPSFLRAHGPTGPGGNAAVRAGGSARSARRLGGRQHTWAAASTPGPHTYRTLHLHETCKRFSPRASGVFPGWGKMNVTMTSKPGLSCPGTEIRGAGRGRTNPVPKDTHRPRHRLSSRC